MGLSRATDRRTATMTKPATGILEAPDRVLDSVGQAAEVIKIMSAAALAGGWHRFQKVQS
jgi:hypothetical protein